MSFDIRLPIGLLFLVFGALLAGFGLLSGSKIYAQHSLGVNVNLVWGLCLLAFGALMTVLAVRSRRSPRA